MNCQENLRQFDLLRLKIFHRIDSWCKMGVILPLPMFYHGFATSDQNSTFQFRFAPPPNLSHYSAQPLTHFREKEKIRFVLEVKIIIKRKDFKNVQIHLGYNSILINVSARFLRNHFDQPFCFKFSQQKQDVCCACNALRP